VTRVIRLTDRNFEAEVLDSDTPVLVEFWGSWCPPCKMMEPTLEQLAADYAGRLIVGKLNVDQNPRMATTYHIQGAPTFIVFASGEATGRRTGAQSEGQLEDLLKEAGAFNVASRPADEPADEEEVQQRLQALEYVETE
jgi:thioredoxin 1